jgi:hypothetical protein
MTNRPDFVARQFIFLTKKLRTEFRKAREALHNDMTRIVNSLQNLKDATHAHWETDEERQKTDEPVTIAELRTDVPIRVQTEPQPGKIKTAGRVLKNTLETIGILAAIVLAIAAVRQLNEITDATNFAGRQTELSRKALNETTKQFRIEQRPMIRVSVIGGGSEGSSPFTFKENDPIQVTIRISNIGKSVARSISGIVGIAPRSIVKNEPPGGQSKNPGEEMRVGAIFPQEVHNETIPLMEQIPGTKQFRQVRFTKTMEDDILNRTMMLELVGRFDYSDSFKIPHWVKFCFSTSTDNYPVNLAKPLTDQEKRCGDYNDVDTN